MAAGISRPLTLACDDWAAIKAAYRFLDNDRVGKRRSWLGISRPRMRGWPRSRARSWCYTTRPSSRSGARTPRRSVSRGRSPRGLPTNAHGRGCKRSAASSCTLVRPLPRRPAPGAGRNQALDAQQVRVRPAKNHKANNHHKKDFRRTDTFLALLFHLDLRPLMQKGQLVKNANKFTNIQDIHVFLKINYYIYFHTKRRHYTQELKIFGPPITNRSL